MRKGYNGSQIITVLNNFGVLSPNYTLPLSGTGFTAGMEVTDLLSCTNSTINSSNTLDVSMRQGLPQVFYPTQLLAGSGMCGTTKKVTKTSGFASPGTPSPSSSSGSHPTATALGLATPRALPTWFYMSLSTLTVVILQHWLASPGITKIY